MVDGQPLRLSCSSLYSTFKFVGQALRIPVRISPDGRWTVFTSTSPRHWLHATGQPQGPRP